MPIIQKVDFAKFCPKKKKKNSNFDDFVFPKILEFVTMFFFKRIYIAKFLTQKKRRQVEEPSNNVNCTVAFFLERDGKSSHILPYLDIDFLEVGMILEIFLLYFQTSSQIWL